MQRRPKRRPRTDWPDLVVSTADTSDAISRAFAAGELKALERPFYSTALDEDPALIFRRNAWKVVATLVPGGVISFRTALEARPAADGAVFLVGAGRYTRDLPGLKIRVVKGIGVQPDDTRFVGGLHLASRPRAMLDALRPSRTRGAVARGLTSAELEVWLEKDFQTGGADALNRLREQARTLSSSLDAKTEFESLDRLIGTLMGTRPGAPTTVSAVARLAGRPYDVQRIALFDRLFQSLQDYSGLRRPNGVASPEMFATTAFFDAYFSNFIEGTEFEVEEARAIVFDQVIPLARPLDAHDVLGTFAVVGHHPTMRHGIQEDASADAFMTRLRQLHARIMAERTHMRPGMFKETANRAGDTQFVAPAHVIGTLDYGFELARGLATPFQRACALMFVLAEVHPFDDGNGRIARALMNAELVAADEARIIIPTVFRDDYLTGLRTLSRAGEAHPFIQVMDYAQRWVAALDWSSFASAERTMRATSAFERASNTVKLRLPAPGHSVTFD